MSVEYAVEVASVSMEIVAFFLVTFDLYGKENVQASAARLSDWTKLAYEKFASWFGEKISIRTFPIFVFSRHDALTLNRCLECRLI